MRCLTTTGCGLRRFAVVVFAALLVCPCAPAQAPSGYRTWTHKKSGLSLYRPSTYKEVPVPPNETVVVSRFVSRNDKRRIRGRNYNIRPATVSVFMLRPGGTTPSGAPAWSFCYFLRESPEVKKHPRWAGLIDKYFESLKRTAVEELEIPPETVAERAQMQQSARDRALEVALEGVKLPELEQAWRKWIARLKNPWPR